MSIIKPLNAPKIRAAQTLSVPKIKSIHALGLSRKSLGDYTTDFYGLERGESIDIRRICQYLKSKLPLKIIYENYKSPTTRQYEVIGTDGVMEVERIINIPFEYTNEYKQIIKSEMKCGINKRYDFVDYIPYANFPFSKDAEFRILYFYTETKQWRQEVANTTSERDFFINDKYVGIQFVSSKINDLYHLLKEIQGEQNAEWYKILVNKKFEEKFKNCKSVEELISLYDWAPDFTLGSLSGETLWKHISMFYKYDTVGTFSIVKDASSSLMRALFAFNTEEKINYLMKQFHKNQNFIKKIYDALDGTIFFGGKEQKCQTVFASIITGFCFADTSTLNFTSEIFYVGKDYYVNVKDVDSNDKEKSKYQVEQRHKTDTYYADSGTVMIEMGGDTVLTSSIKMNPLDIVTVLQKDTDSLIFVPILFLKDQDHQRDVENLLTAVRIGVDMLAIGLTIATFGGASPLLAVAGALEIGIAATDIVVMTNKDKLSEEFLQLWEKIYIIGGIATASPFVVYSLYKLGGKILASSAKAEMKNFVTSCMVKLMLEREISNLSRNTVKVLKTNTELVEATKGALTEFKAKTLNKYGILIIEGEFKTGKTITKEVALVYKGEIILHADRYDFFNKSYPLLKNINNEKEFIKLADELLVYGKEYPVNALKPLVTEAQAISQYGNAGKGLVNAVDNEVQHILQIFTKDLIEEKVMVSGMVYKKAGVPKYFTATNFLKEEIAKGKGKVYLEFLEDLHPTLKIRLNKHIAKLKMNGVLATKNDLLRAGKMGSHGEIRALDKLLKEIDPQGKLGEAVFQDIVGYNRFLWQIEKIQPPCTHCYYLTSGVKFIGF
jgi:hypothetical protein